MSRSTATTAEPSTFGADVTPELASAARRAGLSRARHLSLERIEARRTELWAVMFLALVGVGLTLALLSVDEGDRSLRSFIAALPAFRFGLVLVLAGFAGYVLEQERHLRRLSRMLMDHRMEGEKQAERVAWLTEVDLLKSALVDNMERDVGSALGALRDTVALLEPADDVQGRLLHMVQREVDHAEAVLRAQVEHHDRTLFERARQPVEEAAGAGSANV